MERECAYLLELGHLIASSPALRLGCTPSPPLSQALGHRLNYITHFSGSPAGRQHVTGLLSLHNHMSQFIIIILSYINKHTYIIICICLYIFIFVSPISSVYLENPSTRSQRLLPYSAHWQQRALSMGCRVMKWLTVQALMSDCLGSRPHHSSYELCKTNFSAPCFSHW